MVRFIFLMVLAINFLMTFSVLRATEVATDRFAFNSGYLSTDYTKEHYVWPSLEAALNAEEIVEAVIVSANSDQLVNIKELSELKFLYLDKGFTTNSFYLTKEGLQAFFGIVSQLPNLQYVSIYDCNLLPYLVPVNKLRGLKIEKFDWLVFEHFIMKFSYLEYLYIKDAGVVRIPPKLGELVFLRQLEINCTNLDGLPDIVHLYDLEVLKIKAGKMDRLPYDFNKLEQLKYLEIAGVSEFREFPLEICALSNLEELHINIPFVGYLPDSISNMRSLHKIYLKEAHRLREFPESIIHLKKLNYIYLSTFSGYFNPASLKTLENTFTLALNRGPHVKIAKLLLDNMKLASLEVPMSLLPADKKKLNDLLPNKINSTNL